MLERATMKTWQSGEGLVSNILAVAGFIILIAIIVWGAFHFLSLATDSITSLFNMKGGNSIQITLPAKTIQSGQPLDISWKYSSTGSGTYAFLYQCKDNFQFKLGSGMGSIPCGTAYTIAPASVKSVRVIPILSSGSSLDVPFSILYMQASTTTTSHPQGNATITVLASSSQASATSTIPSMPSIIMGNGSPTIVQNPKSTSSHKTAYSGPADLSVRIIAVGVIDPITNAFVARAPMYPGDMAAVQFDIGNIGGSATGPWAFSAQLPTLPPTPYMSPFQRPLNPGDHIVNTLRFDHLAPGGGMFSVTVDAQSGVPESNKNNNFASQWVGSNYNYQYQSGSYPQY